MTATRTFFLMAGGLPLRVAAPPALPLPPGLDTPPSTADRLSQVTANDLWRPSLRLFPRGRAWGTDESEQALGSTAQHGVARLVAETMAQVHTLFNRALYGAFVSVCSPGLVADWEAEYGLPDPCLAAITDLAARRAMVLGAEMPMATASRLEIEAVLQRLNAPAQISEPLGFAFGRSGFGWRDGFGSADLPFLFLWSGEGLRLNWLSFGGSGFGQIGFGRMSDTAAACLIEKMKPAHTREIFQTELH